MRKRRSILPSTIHISQSYYLAIDEDDDLQTPTNM